MDLVRPPRGTSPPRPSSLTAARARSRSRRRRRRLVLAGVRSVSLAALSRAVHVPRLELKHKAASALDPFAKFVFTTADGQTVEAVRIPLEREGRFTVCVSSQAGCAMACSFCATGRLGLRRNLEAWEIVEQARAAAARTRVASARRPLPPLRRPPRCARCGSGCWRTA